MTACEDGRFLVEESSFSNQGEGHVKIAERKISKGTSNSHGVIPTQETARRIHRLKLCLSKKL